MCNGETTPTNEKVGKAARPARAARVWPPRGRPLCGELGRPGCDYLTMSTTPTPPPSHEAIVHRARALWEEAGRKEGLDLDYWLQAEKELLSQQGPETPSTPPPSTVSSGLSARPAGKRRSAK